MFRLNMPFSVLFSIFDVTSIDNAKLLLWIDKWNSSCIQGAFCGCMILTCHGGSIYCGVPKASGFICLPNFVADSEWLCLPSSVITCACFNYQEESYRAVIIVLQGRGRQMAISHSSPGPIITPSTHNRNAKHFSQVHEWRVTFHWPQRPANLMATVGDFFLVIFLSLKTKWDAEIWRECWRWSPSEKKTILGTLELTHVRSHLVRFRALSEQLG